MAHLKDGLLRIIGGSAIVGGAGVAASFITTNFHLNELLPKDPIEAHAQQAFELLGAAKAVITSLLADPNDQVARTQAQLWLQDLGRLMNEKT